MASIRKRTIRWTTKAGVEREVEKYEAQYVDRNGRRHRQLFVLKRDADRWLQEQTAGIVTGQWVDPRAGRQNLKDFAESWRARQVHADSTEAAFKTVLTNHIYPELGGMKLEAIEPADIQALVKKWSKEAAATTVALRYNMLAIVLRAAVRDRKIPVSPCVDIKLPRVESKAALVPIGTDMVLALRMAMPERYRLFVTLGAGAGMRRGEILGLTHDRVGMDFGTIRVDRQLSRTASGDDVVFAAPKTKAATRTIPVGKVVTTAIREHIEVFGVHKSGLLLTSEIGTPLRTSTLWTAWKKAADKIGADVTPHDLRHYYASVQIRGGTQIKQLQANLGHKSAQETWDTYGHLMGDEDDRSRAVIDGELGKLGHTNGTVEVSEAPAERG
jgi:integrase